MSKEQALLKGINAIRRQRQEEWEKHTVKLLEKVVVLTWLRQGKPGAFEITMFERWGKASCLVREDKEEGFFYINVHLKNRPLIYEIDVQEVMFDVLH